MDDFIEARPPRFRRISRNRSPIVVAEGPPHGFKDLLRHHADVRDRWFLFRSERLHEVMDSWMASNKISPASTPPWRVDARSGGRAGLLRRRART
mgnify:CR=1 FL=1